MLLNVCLRVLPGTTPAASKTNFLRWLDNVIQAETKHNALVYRGSVREDGFYHQIMFDEFLIITSVLSQAFRQWGRDCAANGISCGTCYYVGGTGKGKTMFSYQAEWGPFLT